MQLVIHDVVIAARREPGDAGEKLLSSDGTVVVLDVEDDAAAFISLQ